MNNKVLAEQIQNKYRNYKLKPYAQKRGYKKQNPNLFLIKNKRLAAIISLGLSKGFKKLAEHINVVNETLTKYPLYWNRGDK